jgi:hypothetical protein
VQPTDDRVVPTGVENAAIQRGALVRLLAISDIHGNVSAVRLLRSRETNRFDAIVVAGDIGNHSAPAVFAILGSFGCPVMYVYGNWDHELDYDQSFAACAHIHLTSVKCGPISFAGFSGLPTHWGRNPIAARIRSEVADKHRLFVEKYTRRESDVAAAETEIEARHTADLVELASRAKDRRKSAYRSKVMHPPIIGSSVFLSWT